ncbi:MAG: S8 family peptidase [Acidimicrobiales bacterium]
MFASGAAAGVIVGMLALPAAPASARPAAGLHYKAGPDSSMIVMFRSPPGGLATAGTARVRQVAREQAPVVTQLRASGVKSITSLSLINALAATMSPREAAALSQNKLVASVIPNGEIQGPTPITAKTVGLAGTTESGVSKAAAASCGTKAHPQLNPEALSNINATGATALGYDGAGVTVAFIADVVNPKDPDFTRNAAYASSGSPKGSAVITSDENFTGDPSGTPNADGEAFLDASSIAAQGNTAYDLSKFVSPAHPLPKGCDIKIVGAAPGADVMALSVYSALNDTTESNFIQAIQYAVDHGVKVINESFGGNNFPDTTQDVIRNADDAAVEAGVTVVVSSGDAGISSTMGSPATDPNVISAGASTTYRAYEQAAYGGATVKGASGKYVDNNISDLSSGGYSQQGTTVDLVAPGDLNWALCDSDASEYEDCTNFNGQGSPIEFTGGTSEAAPLTSAGAADVIQAYASSHHGHDPSPALVKQILMSSATDIDAPATQQGAGLLNIKAAVEMAKSLPGTTARGTGGTQVYPNQIDVSQAQGATTTKTISLTNTGSASETVHLSTRGLTKTVATSSGTFCMQPGKPVAGCPANSGSIAIWDGVIEVDQTESFTVPATTGVSRLVFDADYQYTGQGSVEHVALLEPNGAYAMYSEPQGLADFADLEVANPPAGKWTAVFFTEKNGATAGGIGTSGPVQWSARTMEYTAASKISPASLTIAAGKTATATLTLVGPKSAGDSSESVVVASPSGTTTISVVERTLVPITSSGGSFTGVLTGGNGRADAPSQTSTYSFMVPKGEKDIDVTFELAPGALPSDAVVTAFLENPTWETEGYSTNVTTDNFGNPVETGYLNMYHANPVGGEWSVVLEFGNPVQGDQLSEPFAGFIQFNQVHVTSNLPHGTVLTVGKTYTYGVTITNSGISPEAYFVDPRLTSDATVHLLNENSGVDPSKMTLPLGSGDYPYYYVPPATKALDASITSSAPATFDLGYFPGDPDVSPAVATSGVKSASGKDTAGLTFTEHDVSPGLWDMNPSEVGPYPAGGAPEVSATQKLNAVTLAFNSQVKSSTGDLWEAANGIGSPNFNPVYVPAGDSVTITVSITPKTTAAVSGNLLVEDYVLGSIPGYAFPDADVLATLGYGYSG